MLIGDVSICCGDCFKGAIIGNVNNVSLKTLMSCDKFKSIQRANDKLQLDEMLPICKKCDEIYENIFYDMPCKYSKVKKFIKSIAELKNKKLVLFGVNVYMNEFLCAFKILEHNDDCIIIDSFKEGIYEKKQILRPNKDILKDRIIIVFADKKFEEIQKYIQSIGLECISYKQLKE